MPALQVRDFPEDLYEDLRARARENHRSITQETIIAVKQYLLTRSRFKLIDLESSSPTESDQADRRSEQDPDWYSIEYRTVNARDLPEYSQKRRRDEALAYLRAQPVITDPDGFPSSAELIREDRDNR